MYFFCGNLMAKHAIFELWPRPVVARVLTVCIFNLSSGLRQILRYLDFSETFYNLELERI